MRGAWLLGLGVAGCYHPTVADCAYTCSADSDCPSGLACDTGHACRVAGAAGACGTTPDAPGPPDGFGMAHDEDGDGIPDSQDNCPNVANDDQLDGDSDQVGDVCDPNPHAAGDTILLFESFESSPAQLGVSGPWTFADDDARATGSTAFLFASTSVAATSVFATLSVENPQGQVNVGVFSGDPGLPPAVACAGASGLDCDASAPDCLALTGTAMVATQTAWQGESQLTLLGLFSQGGKILCVGQSTLDAAQLVGIGDLKGSVVGVGAARLDAPSVLVVHSFIVYGVQ